MQGTPTTRRPERAATHDFDPRSPCGERQGDGADVERIDGVSIHAPHVGSDKLPLGSFPSYAPFQSTLPMWGATSLFREAACRRAISIHAPMRGRQDLLTYHSYIAPFQSTPPCGERRQSWRRCFRLRHFNPRSPCGERLRADGTVTLFGKISIHAPHAGSDPPGPDIRGRGAHFNPRSPCGERPRRILKQDILSRFQSTLPVWGATSAFQRLACALLFQSTLPVWGATRSDHSIGNNCGNFNSRSPCGERRSRAGNTQQL